MLVIAYIIAAVSLTAFLILWFAVVYRDLSKSRDETEKAAQVVTMHEAFCAQTKDGEKEWHAKQMLNTSKRIYFKVCDNYNRALRIPLNRFPAWVMGFRVTKN